MSFHLIADWRVQHEETRNLLRAAWVGGRNLARLRPTLVALRQLAEDLRVTRVLLELDTLPDLPVLDQLWLGTTWMPTVLPLPLQQVVLVLGSASVYNAQAIEMLLAMFRAFIRFDVQFFTQAEPGLQWLLPDDALTLAHLLAEWQLAYHPSGPASDSFAECRPAYGPPSALALPT